MLEIYPINEDTWKLFEPFGFSEHDFYTLPKEDLEMLCMGQTTSLLPLRLTNSDGETVERLARLGFVRKPDGNVEVKAYPQYDEIQTGDLDLSKRDIERLKRQGVIYTEAVIDGQRNRCFVQLDPLTNCLLYARADDIGRLIPTDIHGTELTRIQRDKIRQGKSVEVKVGNQTYVVGIDLEKRNGFKVWRIANLNR
jgi:hypothetical protein